MPPCLAYEAPAAQERMTVQELDLCGLKCPLPALKTKKALAQLSPGERLNVVTTDPLAAIDIPNLVRESGDVLVASSQAENRMNFVIEKA